MYCGWCRNGKGWLWPERQRWGPGWWRRPSIGRFDSDTPFWRQTYGTKPESKR